MEIFNIENFARKIFELHSLIGCLPGLEFRKSENFLKLVRKSEKKKSENNVREKISKLPASIFNNKSKEGGKLTSCSAPPNKKEGKGSRGNQFQKPVDTLFYYF